MNLNQCQLIGRVTKDPEIKTLPSGSSVASFGLATNRIWKDKEGTKKEEVEFHNLITFGKSADLIKQYVTKGQLLYVQGRIQTRSWEGKDGKKNYKTEILVENFQFGPKAQGTAAPAKSESDKEYDKYDEKEEEISADSIPF